MDIIQFGGGSMLCDQAIGKTPMFDIFLRHDRYFFNHPVVIVAFEVNVLLAFYRTKVSMYILPIKGENMVNCS